MNEQSGFNAEQIEKDNYPESKIVWTDDLLHHRSIQVKRDNHTFSSKNCMDIKGTLRKNKNLSIISYT